MDIHVRYRDEVADRANIDRAAWAALIAQLIDTTADGNQTKFATTVKVTPRTVSRWLNQEVSVNSDNVRDVARLLGHNPTDMLVQVGYLRPEETSRGRREPLDPDVRKILAMLADPTTPPEQRQFMRQMLRSLAAMPAPQHPAEGGQAAAQ